MILDQKEIQANICFKKLNCGNWCREAAAVTSAVKLMNACIKTAGAVGVLGSCLKTYGQRAPELQRLKVKIHRKVNSCHQVVLSCILTEGFCKVLPSKHA